MLLIKPLWQQVLEARNSIVYLGTILDLLTI